MMHDQRLGSVAVHVGEQVEDAQSGAPTRTWEELLVGGRDGLKAMKPMRKNAMIVHDQPVTNWSSKESVSMRRVAGIERNTPLVFCITFSRTTWPKTRRPKKMVHRIIWYRVTRSGSLLNTP